MVRKAVLMSLAAMLIMLGASVAGAGVGPLFDMGIVTGGLVGGEAFYHDGVVPAAGLQASVNPGGIGDALIYGYYNVRGNLGLFNIVNTDTTHGKKVRVVFRNGKNSKEILDFSVCLSRGDVWTAYVLDDGTAGRIFQFDTDTITAPSIPAAGQQFKFGGTTLSDVTGDDTKEGYIEVIGLSYIPSYDKNASDTGSCTSGTKRNCIRSATACANWNGSDGVYNFLFGNMNLIELSTLATYAYNATAIADAFHGTAFTDPGPGSELSIPTSMDAPTSFSGVEGIPESGCVAFDWLFMKGIVYSPYDIVSGLGGETELILTFPSRLKCHATTANFEDNDGDINELGDAMFDCTKHSVDDPTKCTAYCTKVGIDVWDDKENEQSILDFSPAVGSCLPHEVNVVKIGASNIWNSTLATSINVGSFQMGWIVIDLIQDVNTTNHWIVWTDDSLAYGGTNWGLPVISYTTQSFVGAGASYMVPTSYRTSLSAE